MMSSAFHIRQFDSKDANRDTSNPPLGGSHGGGILALALLLAAIGAVVIAATLRSDDFVGTWMVDDGHSNAPTIAFDGRSARLEPGAIPEVGPQTEPITSGYRVVGSRVMLDREIQGQSASFRLETGDTRAEDRLVLQLAGFEGWRGEYRRVH